MCHQQSWRDEVEQVAVLTMTGIVFVLSEISEVSVMFLVKATECLVGWLRVYDDGRSAGLTTMASRIAGLTTGKSDCRFYDW